MDPEVLLPEQEPMVPLVQHPGLQLLPVLLLPVEELEGMAAQQATMVQVDLSRAEEEVVPEMVTEVVEQEPTDR